jgi:hypothetical protein
MPINTYTLSNQKIWFICNGTSINDIIYSINKNVKNDSFFSIFSTPKNNNLKKINKLKFSKLVNTGMKEAFLVNENQEIDNIISGSVNIYTSLDYNSIETSLILSRNYPQSSTGMTPLVIKPIGNISNETNIKNIKDYDILKKKFGNYKSNLNVTVPNNYWKIKDINNNFLDIKKLNIELFWENNKNISYLSNYNFQKFKKELPKLCCLTNYSMYIPLLLTNIDDTIFICNGKLIEDVLKLFKDVKYNKKIDIIEHSSVWVIDVDFLFSYDTSLGGLITDYSISKYNYFKKLYPTEYNHKPLKNSKNLFTFKYNDHEYPLFNALSTIPIKYIKNMDLSKIIESNSDNKMIKKILNSIPDNKKKNENNKNNNIRKTTKKSNEITFETLN